jgi:hypothetical protein
MYTVLAGISNNFAISKVSAVELLQGNMAALYYDTDGIHVATCLILRPNFSQGKQPLIFAIECLLLDEMCPEH